MYVENDLMGKLRLISKFMTSQTGQKIISIHITPNISRSKSNQPMKGVKERSKGSKGNERSKGNQSVIKHSVRNIFLQKSCKK